MRRILPGWLILPSLAAEACAVDAAGRLLRRSGAPYDNYREALTWDFNA